MPAELREIMYDYLLEPEYIVTYVEGLSQSDIDAIICHPNRESWGRTKALCGPLKVGQQLADEISYSLLSRQTVDVLDLLRLSSALQSQMLPRGVRVHFWGQDSTTVFSGLKAAPDVLKLLLSKQVQAGTAIEFVIHFLLTEDCTDFLRIIAPSVFKLKEKGVDVTIIRSYKSICNSPSRYLAGKFFLDWDLSWLFASDFDYFTRSIVNNKKRKHRCIVSACSCIVFRDMDAN